MITNLLTFPEWCKCGKVYKKLMEKVPDPLDDYDTYLLMITMNLEMPIKYFSKRDDSCNTDEEFILLHKVSLFFEVPFPKSMYIYWQKKNYCTFEPPEFITSIKINYLGEISNNLKEMKINDLFCFEEVKAFTFNINL